MERRGSKEKYFIPKIHVKLVKEWAAVICLCFVFLLVLLSSVFLLSISLFIILMSRTPPQSNEGSRRRNLAAGRGNVGIQLAFWHFLLRSHASHCSGSWFSECNTLFVSCICTIFLDFLSVFLPETQAFWCLIHYSETFMLPTSSYQNHKSVCCSDVKIWFRFLQSLCKVSVAWRTFL